MLDAPPAEQLEVLLLDQLYRWRNGCPKPVEEYLAEHPTLTGDPEVRLKLIQGEFLARLERDEDPDPAAYIEKFPDLAEEIRTQMRGRPVADPVGRLELVRPALAETADLEGTEANDQGSPPYPRPPPRP